MLRSSKNFSEQANFHNSWTKPTPFRKWRINAVFPHWVPAVLPVKERDLKSATSTPHTTDAFVLSKRLKVRTSVLSFLWQPMRKSTNSVSSKLRTVLWKTVKWPMKSFMSTRQGNWTKSLRKPMFRRKKTERSKAIWSPPDPRTAMFCRSEKKKSPCRTFLRDKWFPFQPRSFRSLNTTTQTAPLWVQTCSVKPFRFSVPNVLLSEQVWKSTSPVTPAPALLLKVTALSVTRMPNASLLRTMIYIWKNTAVSAPIIFSNTINPTKTPALDKNRAACPVSVSKKAIFWLTVPVSTKANSPSAKTLLSPLCHGAVTTTKTPSLFPKKWWKRISILPSISRNLKLSPATPSSDPKKSQAIFRTSAKICSAIWTAAGLSALVRP